MTYRLASTLLGVAFFATACAPATESASTSGTESTAGDGDAGGDGDEVFLGTGGGLLGDGDILSGSGGNVLGDGDGDGVGDGDAPGVGAALGDGDGDITGDGDGDPPAATGGTAQGTGGEASGGNTNSGAGGSISMTECSPNPSGEFVADGDIVFDERTCLTWMRDNTTGDPYSEAVAYCDELILGGYEDWRIPTAGEAATIFKCDGMWPPIDDTVFNVMGDGIWTSTESGTIAGDLPKVCGAGQSSGNYYDFGQVGGQHTRCVRGTSDVPDRPNCKSDSTICQ